MIRRQLTDEFLGEVATCYRAAVDERANPGVSIACRYHVPVATAHRWIYEARQRGVMAGGQQGVADGWHGKCYLTVAMRQAIATAIDTGDLADLRREFGRL